MCAYIGCAKRQHKFHILLCNNCLFFHTWARTPCLKPQWRSFNWPHQHKSLKPAASATVRLRLPSLYCILCSGHWLIRRFPSHWMYPGQHMAGNSKFCFEIHLITLRSMPWKTLPGLHVYSVYTDGWWGKAKWCTAHLQVTHRYMELQLSPFVRDSDCQPLVAGMIIQLISLFRQDQTWSHISLIKVQNHLHSHRVQLHALRPFLLCMWIVSRCVNKQAGCPLSS